MKRGNVKREKEGRRRSSIPSTFLHVKKAFTAGVSKAEGRRI